VDCHGGKGNSCPEVTLNPGLSSAAKPAAVQKLGLFQNKFLLKVLLMAPGNSGHLYTEQVAFGLSIQKITI